MKICQGLLASYNLRISDVKSMFRASPTPEGLEEALDYMIETLAMSETMHGHDGSFYHEQLQLFHCDMSNV